MAVEPLQGITSISFKGGYLALDFTNTVHNSNAKQVRDEVAGYPDLVVWSRRAGITSAADEHGLLEAGRKHPRKAAGVVSEARKLRKLIYQVFLAVAERHRPKPTLVKQLEKRWMEAMEHASLVAGPEGFDWSWAPRTGVRMDQMLWPIARSAMELLTSPDCRRIHLCNARDCTWLFLDKTKNKSRRWCDMESCGNREKARRHYSKTRSQQAH